MGGYEIKYLPPSVATKRVKLGSHKVIPRAEKGAHKEIMARKYNHIFQHAEINGTLFLFLRHIEPA